MSFVFCCCKFCKILVNAPVNAYKGMETRTLKYFIVGNA